MPDLIAIVGFFGGWLLVAGPLLQAVSIFNKAPCQRPSRTAS
jgi:hypothetical protein